MEVSQVSQDILNTPRFQGAIDSISFITDITDSIFVAVITFVAFLIISCAILKNVLAGAYCSFPKFWNKVAEAHSGGTSLISAFQGVIGKGNSSGSLSVMLYRACPNIKALTDFEANEVTAKAYWMKALPPMLLAIMIGAFIYNGFYRDVSAKVADFGSTLFNKVFMEADPVALWEQMTNMSMVPNFSTDGSNDKHTQFQNDVAQSTYSVVIGKYNDITSEEAKTALAHSIASWVLDQTAGLVDYTAGDGWKYSLDIRLVYGEPDLSMIHDRWNENKTNYQVAFTAPVSYFNVDSAIDVGVPNYVRVLINFDKQASSGPVTKVDDLVMNITSDFAIRGNNVEITLPSISNASLTVSGTISFGGKPAELSGNTLIIKNAKDLIVNGSSYPIGGLYYRVGSYNSRITTAVTNVSTNSVAIVSFSSATVGDFAYGEAIPQPSEQVLESSSVAE